MGKEYEQTNLQKRKLKCPINTKGNHSCNNANTTKLYSMFHL